MCSATRARQIAAEKLAVAGPSADGRAAGRRVRARSSRARGADRRRRGGGRSAASGGRVARLPTPALPGRLELRGGAEVRDGAHTPEAVDWLLERLPRPAATSSSRRSSPTRTRDGDPRAPRPGRARSSSPPARRTPGRSAGRERRRARPRGWFADGRDRPTTHGARSLAPGSSARAFSSPARSTCLPICSGTE